MGLSDIWKFLTFKKFNARFCPKCKSFNVHSVFGNPKKQNSLGTLVGTQYKCFDCGFRSVLFPQKTIERK